jgi:spermidine/putrescine transport system ATP-binding protein
MAQDERGAGVGHRDAAHRHGSGAISIRGLRKEFDGVTAVDGIDVEIGAGEFFTLLGPSGCGKTTTLRMLAGFEQPTDGQILLDGVDVARTPAHKRPVNTVFQSYALFPHLDVRKNVEYGLRWRKDVDSKTRAARVARALELVRLTDYAKRRPHQMSGGQQQRVALARALVLEPSVLLLDEPLGALDAKLRHSLRAELTSLQRDVGITFVFVTHDQEEALEMSDRLAVMDGGRIAQLGTPQQVYQEPRSEFVADFLGVANLMDVECLPGSGRTRLVRFGEFTLEAQAPDGCDVGLGRAIIRPECVEVSDRGLDGGNRVPGMVDKAVFLGSTTQVSVRLPHGAVVQSLVTNASVEGGLTSGQAVSVHLPPEALRVLSTSSSASPEAPVEV